MDSMKGSPVMGKDCVDSLVSGFFVGARVGGWVLGKFVLVFSLLCGTVPSWAWRLQLPVYASLPLP
jgi:hypothetical protein